MMKGKDNKEDDDILISFFKEINKVKDNDRSVVVITHGVIELLITTITTSVCIEGSRIRSNSRDYPQSVKLVLLREKGVLDKDLFSILNRFRKLRNGAVHDPFFHLKEKDVDFIKSSYKRFLPGDIPPYYNISNFCEFLVSTIWNESLDILMPIFINDNH